MDLKYDNAGCSVQSNINCTLVNAHEFERVEDFLFLLRKNSSYYCNSVVSLRVMTVETRSSYPTSNPVSFCNDIVYFSCENHKITKTRQKNTRHNETSAVRTQLMRRCYNKTHRMRNRVRLFLLLMYNKLKSGIA